jgi:glycosyltransferase involved in cell wall biosynthesis
MKIAIADNTGLKFCQDLKEHWEAKGHEVRYERGASEYLAQWADVYYVEWIEGNLDYLWKIYNGADGVSRTPDWDNNKKPKIVCRMIDWDLWCGFVPFYEKKYIDFIDKAICIAPHIEKMILDKAPEYKGKLKLIRPGVNLDKFTMKTNQTNGFQVGMVLGDMWWPKNHMGGLDIFTSLYNHNPNWRLHIRGQHEGGTEYWKLMYEHYLDSRGIRNAVKLYEPVENMNYWYENIDYLLHPGMKETFCYAVGEAMAKGIKPVINNFLGAENIWSGEYLYNTHQGALSMFRNDANHIKPNPDYRAYIEKNYDVKRQLKETDEFLEL